MSVIIANHLLRPRISALPLGFRPGAARARLVLRDSGSADSGKFAMAGAPHEWPNCALSHSGAALARGSYRADDGNRAAMQE